MTESLPSHLRSYRRDECIPFRKTKEKFGGLSNMAGGFDLLVNGVSVRTTEALYQACRFPRLPEVQRRIIGEKSPMSAKMVGKPYRTQTREDWEFTRTKIMRWVLQVKLCQHPEKFGNLLLETGNLPIVEDSHKDTFWGAKPVDGLTLIGENILGRLLMQLREEFRADPGAFLWVRPLRLPEFFLYGDQIGDVFAQNYQPVGAPVEEAKQLVLIPM